MRWKSIPKYEEIYIINENGDIFSLERVVDMGPKGLRTINGRELKNNKNSPNGYYQIQLCKRGNRLMAYPHVIVATLFVENPYNKPQVNHIDGNKLNNHYSNLEWVTSSENQVHAYKNGLQIKRVGEAVGTCKLKSEDVRHIKKLLISGHSVFQLASMYNVCLSTIKNIRSGHTWDHVSIDVLKRLSEL